MSGQSKKKKEEEERKHFETYLEHTLLRHPL
jgi:hypothetical protein